MVWTPRVTVAAVIEQQGRYLMVEEDVGEVSSAFNQPAGHLEAGESVVQAAIREVMEETGQQFTPQAITGIYRWIAPSSGETYLRVCFYGQATQAHPPVKLDTDIVATHWLTLDEITALKGRLRSPLVVTCIEDYLNGCRYPLSLFKESS